MLLRWRPLALSLLLSSHHSTEMYNARIASNQTYDCPRHDGKRDKIPSYIDNSSRKTERGGFKRKVVKCSVCSYIA